MTATFAAARKICAFASRHVSIFARWRNEARNRHALARMNERALRDIGLSHIDFAARCAKPFLTRYGE